MATKDKIIVALDVDSLAKALKLVEQLHPYVGCFKAGLELLTSEGPDRVVYEIKERGGNVFYDGKFMDIPNTVAGACRAVTKLGVEMFNVHCLGGSSMMQAAVKAAQETAHKADEMMPLILGVTILTSLDYNDLVEMRLMEELNIADLAELAEIRNNRMQRLVQNLAFLAQEAGLGGVIASPQEIATIRQYCGPDLLVVTPGVRPAWAAVGDQKRVMTPGEAVKAGANFLVIGRPITQPPPEIGGPVKAAQRIAKEINEAMG